MTFFVYDVTLFQLVLVYFCECVWIGIARAIKLITASIIGDPHRNRVAEPFKHCLALLVTIAASLIFVAVVPGLASTSAFAVVVIVPTSIPANILFKSYCEGRA